MRLMTITAASARSPSDSQGFDFSRQAVSNRLIAKIRDINMPATKCATQKSGVEVMKICQFCWPSAPSGK